MAVSYTISAYDGATMTVIMRDHGVQPVVVVVAVVVVVVGNFIHFRSEAPSSVLRQSYACHMW